MPAELTDLPVFAMSVLLKKFDLKTIQILRKVCRFFRLHINSVQLDFGFKQVHVLAKEPTLMVIKFSWLPPSDNDRYWDRKDVMSFVYEKSDSNCLIKHNGESKLLENMDFMEVAANDLGLILLNQKSICDKLVFKFEENPDVESATTSYDRFLNSFEKKLKCQRTKMPVKLLKVENVFKQDHLMKILNCLHPQQLKGAYICFEKDILKARKTMEMDSVVKMSLWKQLDEISITGLVLNELSICDFMHFKNAFCIITTVSAQDLKTFRNTVLCSPTFSYMLFFYRNFPDEEDFIKIFGEPSEENRLLSKIWYYKLPEENKVLRVLWWLSNQSFSIRPVAITDVPDDIEILNFNLL